MKNSADSGNTRQAATAVSFLRNVLLREPSFRVALAEIKPSDTTIGEVFTKPLKLPTPDFSPAEPDMALEFSTVAVENSKANFAKAIFLGGENAPVVAWSDEKETHIGKTILPVSAQNANQIIAFDFDYDFKNDLAIATEKGFQLFKQTEGENFQDVTANTKLPNEMLQKSYAGVWTFDVESDGDLDLVLGTKYGTPIVLQNNADGSFKEIKLFAAVEELREFISADFDEDGDSDVVTTNSGYKIHFFSNERGGVFRERKLPDLDVVLATTVGDANGDGKLDLVVSKPNENVVGISDKNNGNDFEVSEIVKGDFCAAGKDLSKCQLKLADFDNNGANDLLEVNANSTRIILTGKRFNIFGVK